MIVKEVNTNIIGEVVCYKENTDQFVVKAAKNNQFYLCARDNCVSIGKIAELVQESFLDRLINESDQLDERRMKLLAALNSKGFEEKVGTFQFNLMKKQFNAMTDYYGILQMRISPLLREMKPVILDSARENKKEQFNPYYDEQAGENKADASVRKL